MVVAMMPLIALWSQPPGWRLERLRTPRPRSLGLPRRGFVLFPAFLAMRGGMIHNLARMPVRLFCHAAQ